jgi:hypothetical protein
VLLVAPDRVVGAASPDRRQGLACSLYQLDLSMTWQNRERCQSRQGSSCATNIHITGCHNVESLAMHSNHTLNQDLTAPPCARCGTDPSQTQCHLLKDISAGQRPERRHQNAMPLT